MASATASEALLAAAFWAGIASLAVSAAMLAAILLLRTISGARATRERQVADRWRGVLAACAGGASPQAGPLDPAEAYVFLRLWNAMHESLRGEAKEQLNDLARRVGADRIAVRFLGSGDPRRELVAILTLGNLREPLVADLMHALAGHDLPVVSMRAMQALLRIDARRGLPILLSYAGWRVDWPLSRVISLLREEDAGAVSRALAEALEAALASPEAASRAPRLLRLAEAAHPEILRPALQRALARDDAETLAAALAALRHPDDVAHARRLASHGDWRVRLQASRALRRLGTAEDLPRLVGLMADPNWWVRYRSAQAVAALPWLAAPEVDRIAAGLTDRFAADALRQARAELAA